MNRSFRTFSRAGCLVIVALFAVFAFGQQPETLICSECDVENPATNRFCSNCGESMADELSHWVAENQKGERFKRRFISERIDPPRLFSVPTARVLGSMDIRVVGGGAFGVATDQSFLGKVGIGLGDIAEVEFSTVGMVTNIARGSTVFPTSAFKLLLIPENRWHLPTLAVAFRSSANWQDVLGDESVIKAAGMRFREEDGRQVKNLGYDTRFTTMYVVSTLRLWTLSLHGGATLTDVRVKELSVDYWNASGFQDSTEKQKNLIGGFFGFDIESNPQTKLMFELQTESNYEYNVKKRRIDVNIGYMATGGVRFFFNRWLSTDVGVWYHSAFRGIADLQIKVGLNLFIPGGNFGRKVVGVRS